MVDWRGGNESTGSNRNKLNLRTIYIEVNMEPLGSPVGYDLNSGHRKFVVLEVAPKIVVVQLYLSLV